MKFLQYIGSKIILFGMLLLICFCMTGCGEKETEVTKASELDKKDAVIGVAVGSEQAVFAEKFFKKAEVIAFNSHIEGYTALKNGKINAYCYSKVPLEYSIADGLEGVYLLNDDSVGEEVEIGVGISRKTKVKQLNDRINRFILKIKANGIFDDMYNRWVYQCKEEMPKINVPTNAKETLVLGTTGISPPFSYYKNTKITGMDVELIRRFCAEENMNLKIKIYDYNGVIVAAERGTIDCIAADLNKTKERMEKIDFSRTLYTNRTGFLLKGTNEKKLDSTKDLNGQRMGVISSTTFDRYTDQYISNARKAYYKTYTDMALAVKQGKLDGFLMDEPQASVLIKNNNYLSRLNEYLKQEDYAIGFQKSDEGARLREQMNEFLEKLTKNGTLLKLKNIWFGKDESQRIIDDSKLNNVNGVIKLATNSSNEPFSYMKDGKHVGYEMDIVTRFCKEYGYALEISDMDTESVIPALTSGKCNMAAKCVTVTEERKKQVDFSIADYHGGVVVVVDGNRMSNTVKYHTVRDLSEQRIGTVRGTILETVAAGRIENPKFCYYDTFDDEIAALKEGKIDAILQDNLTAKCQCMNNDSLKIMQENMGTFHFGFGFPQKKRNQTLYTQMNTYIRTIKKSGKLKEYVNQVQLPDEKEQKKYDIKKLIGTNGTIHIGAYMDNPSFSYLNQGKVSGLDMDILYGFCQKYGYRLKIHNMSFDKLMKNTNNFDIVLGGVTITKEREKIFKFTEAYYEDEVVAIILASDKKNVVADEAGFFASIKESFQRNFLRESRWKLVVSGLWVTIIISILSAIFGTAFGFGICFLRRAKNIVLSKMAAVFIRIIQGTPIVVLLMILYYVVFGSVDINAIIVAVIGFSINFGVYVSEMIRTGLDAVDKGQIEAARALGFRKRKTFIKITLPQAAMHFLPVYKGEFISMIKMTSVVGYIAIQDLTKASDIIRSRTYEAFFPLIVTALIYFAVAYLFIFLLSRFELRFQPKRHMERKLKGIKRVLK